VKADIELGGTDQRFNVIAGRFMQKGSGMEPQVGLFTPILAGLDGRNKMSKSLNNYIGLNDKPEDMFGKVMSIPDEMIRQYFELLTDVPLDEVSSMDAEMKACKVNPRDIKMKLGFNVVKKYIGENEAKAGQEHFLKAFSEKEIPYDRHKQKWAFEKEEVSVAEFFKGIDAAASNSDARRIVEQGGFYLNDKRVEDFKHVISKKDMPFTFKVGKKKFGMFE
jgi:tyrosyl-tRNA synthetase